MTPRDPPDDPLGAGIDRDPAEGGRIGRRFMTKRNVLRLLILLLILAPVVDYLLNL